MLKLHNLFFLLTFGIALAQPPKMKLTPGGFEPITVSIPSTKTDKLVSLTQTWVVERDRRSTDPNKKYDITNVSNNTITVTSFQKNAFYYTDRGEEFEHRIQYTMKFTFYENRYDLTFNIDQIYTDNNVPLKSGISDFFKNDDTLKEGYTDLDTSLERTVNEIVLSHYNALINYR